MIRNVEESAGINERNDAGEDVPLRNESEQDGIITHQDAEADEPRPASCWDKVPIIGTCHKLYGKYDGTFLTMLGM